MGTEKQGDVSIAEECRRLPRSTRERQGRYFFLHSPWKERTLCTPDLVTSRFQN